jgi:hypothetical protein
LREGDCSVVQWQFLQARNPEAIANFGTADFADATYFFATIKAVNRRINFKLPKLQMPITLLPQMPTTLPVDKCAFRWQVKVI